MDIIVDTREAALQAAWVTLPEARPFSVKQLDIGDVWLVPAEPDMTTGHAGIAALALNAMPVVLFERKTYADLAASLKDGRWYEQKSRIRAAGIPLVVYVFEGAPSWEHFATTCTLASQVFDGFRVIYSSGPSHTARIIHTVWKKLVLDKDGWTPEALAAECFTC